jgi:molecular chaperone GrpE (heat shock protein)
MSSSAERNEGFGWSAFADRPAGLADVELRSPARELAAVLQRYQQDIEAERTAGREAVEQVLAIAATQAALLHRLGVVLEQGSDKLREAGVDDVRKQLSIVRNQMLDALAKAGLTVVDPVGKTFDEAEAQVEVVGWRHGTEFTDEVVTETIEPIVLHDETVIHHGRVIMGAPQNSKEHT